jgi:DNA replication protein DnaC
MNKQQHKKLIELLKELHLPMFREYHQEFAQAAAADELGYKEYLYELAQRECEVRRANKIARLIKMSKLPLEKTLQTFELNRMPLNIRRQVKVLSEGSFADRNENILAFGKPGSGKTHLLCGICHELARQGRKVYFATCIILPKNWAHD